MSPSCLEDNLRTPAPARLGIHAPAQLVISSSSFEPHFSAPIYYGGVVGGLGQN